MRQTDISNNIARQLEMEEAEATFDFNLPHNIDAEEDAAPSPHLTGRTQDFDTSPQSKDIIMGGQYNDTHNLNYRQFSPGFSDDDGSGEAFESSWFNHQAHNATASTAKGEKSPRRPDSDEETPDISIQAKKPRCSLFGGPVAETEEQRTGNLSSLATPELNIGCRLSSMNIDQQQYGDDDDQQRINTGSDLACSDIGSVRNSPAPSDEGFLFHPDDVAPYELRQNIDRKKAFTYVDTDKSGNWDPEQETRERAAKLLRAKTAKRERRERKKRKGKTVDPKEHVMKYIVRLPIQNFGNVRNSTDDQDHWPEGWSDLDSEQERELKEQRKAHRDNNSKCKNQSPIIDPANEVDDLTGYPAARGCRQCRILKQTCSMVKSGSYPCKECSEDDDECQPIQTLTVKTRCKECDRTSEDFCSFEDGSVQLICDHCVENDRICEAVPPESYKAQRIDLDAITYGSDRLSVACMACLALNKRCSLKKKEENPPCKSCQRNNTGCTFRYHKEESKEERGEPKVPLAEITPKVSIPTHEWFTPEDLSDLHQEDSGVVSREPTPELEMEDAEGNSGLLTKIRTSFAHPIQFHVHKSANSDCNFCELPIFGMAGHFEREVHVIRWYSGLGYAEVGGGHCQDTGETTMCTDCSNWRLQVMVCPEHKLEPITGVTLDFDTLAEDLTKEEVEGADQQYQLSRWCSTCFAPASFRCSTVQPDLVVEGTEIPGCRLRLCVACEKALCEEFNGTFDTMVTEMDRQPKIAEADELLGMKIEGRPRADVGFLNPNGLLMLNSGLKVQKS